jgi:hypothetical protein
MYGLVENEWQHALDPNGHDDRGDYVPARSPRRASSTA